MPFMQLGVKTPNYIHDVPYHKRIAKVRRTRVGKFHYKQKRSDMVQSFDLQSLFAGNKDSVLAKRVRKTYPKFPRSDMLQHTRGTMKANIDAPLRFQYGGKVKDMRPSIYRDDWPLTHLSDRAETQNKAK